MCSGVYPVDLRAENVDADYQHTPDGARSKPAVPFSTSRSVLSHRGQSEALATSPRLEAACMLTNIENVFVPVAVHIDETETSTRFQVVWGRYQIYTTSSGTVTHHIGCHAASQLQNVLSRFFLQIDLFLLKYAGVSALKRSL